MPDINKPLDRVEITKRVDRAEKLLQKGKTAEALDEYLQVLAADPANDTITQMAADLSLSLQRIPQAVKLLGGMFERQVQAGDATRASLTYKKLARFADPTWEQKLRFGGLLENTNRKLAIETYEHAFQELTKQGRKQESLAVLQRILRLDAGEKNLLRLGELSSEVGDGKTAAAAFLRLGELTKVSGGNSAPWIERAYAQDPSDPQIALAYGKGLLEQGQADAAIQAMESQVNAGSVSEEMRQTYAQALLAANRLSDAEAVVWQLFKDQPARSHDIAKLIGLYLDAGQEQAAVALSRKFAAHQQRRGDRRGFLSMMQEIIVTHAPSAVMLEFMCELFNAANRETDYCHTLLKLFDLHCSTGNYDKAAEFLDRAAEVDAYEHGHHKRLQMLQGKIDDRRYNAIASRLSGAQGSATAPVRSGENLLGDAALQDLMLQAEILVQYGMRSKALERLQRIQQLFPHEEDRNHALHQLYLNAGLVPKYPSAERPAESSIPRVAPTAVPAPPPQPDPASQSPADLSSFARVAEITRKIYRQSHADTVLATAASEIGEQWKASRCVVAMRKPGLRPTSSKEYCGEATAAAESGALEKLIVAVHDLTIQRGGTLGVGNVQLAPEPEMRDLLVPLGVASLLALSLVDGNEHVGILILTQSTPLAWNSNELLVLKTICDQIVIALNNAGLRRLVKSLSVTDERSGLLKRASYLDLLMAETRRNMQQGTPLSVLLMQFGDKTSLIRELGESGVEALMQEIGRLFSANIRQNDLAFRYEATTIAIVLGETGEKDGLLAAEKLQRLTAQAKAAERKEALRFNAGLAQAVIRNEYDPVDIVTEVINRAEQALSEAAAQGTNKTVALVPALANSAVA
ncbi:MAG TPA: diguanylate cyclase [Terriglobales bacterium]|nr:diguanylate cyclase [Terriglobales bacterium]